MTITLVRVSDGMKMTVDSQRVVNLLRPECVPEDEYEEIKKQPADVRGQLLLEI